MTKILDTMTGAVAHVCHDKKLAAWIVCRGLQFVCFVFAVNALLNIFAITSSIVTTAVFLIAAWFIGKKIATRLWGT